VSGLKFGVLFKPIKCCAGLEVLITVWMMIETSGICCHVSVVWLSKQLEELAAFYPEDRCNKPFRNVSNCSPLDAAPYPGKLESSITYHLNPLQNIFRLIEEKPFKRHVNLTFHAKF
jgi:hypothetical protein